MYKGGPPPPHLSNSDRPISEIDAKSIVSPPRLYQVWKGSNRFFLGGRLIFGPDFRSLFLTMSLILVPVVLFCAFVCKGFVDKFPHQLGCLIIVLTCILTAYIIFLLFLTSGTDPGIIPRNSHPPEPDDDESNISIDWAGSQSGYYSLPPIKEVTINGVIVRVKYCPTCMLYRPPRCSHCSICNNCVERFDHHCPWVGQCIGKRNYRFFFMFVSSTTILCLYVFAFCWVNIRILMGAHHYSLWMAFMKSPASGFLILYTFLAAWFIGGLTTFHLYLISTNQTTYENFRYRYDRKRNPYNVGCASNFREIFFSKIPKSKNNFRAKVKRDTSVLYSSKSLDPSTSLDKAKSNFDVELGNRQAVSAEEFDDMQKQIESFGGIDRSGSQPTHDRDQNSYWQTRHGMNLSDAEVGMEQHGIGDREKIEGSQ